MIKIGDIEMDNDLPFVFIGGPCVIESEAHAFTMAYDIKAICDKLDIPFIFKSSFDKANRTSIDAYRGPGCAPGCRVLSSIKKRIGVPVLTDIHTVEQAYIAANFHHVDVIQIPAMLCRQTDLLIAASRAKAPVMVKKMQSLAPGAMKHVVEKLQASDTEYDKTDVILCERGSTFGHGDLVVDYRGIVVMKEFAPVVFDATHSVQQAGDGFTSGNRAMVPHLAKAAVAVGVAGIFMECHNDPDNAPSDGANMVKIEDLEGILTQLKAFDVVAKSKI